MSRLPSDDETEDEVAPEGTTDEPEASDLDPDPTPDASGTTDASDEPLLDRLTTRAELILERVDQQRIGWPLPAWLLLGFLAARWVTATTWYWGAETKAPWDDFGWLPGWLRVEAAHSPIPGYPWLIENVLLPNIELVGWQGFLIECWLAAAFFLGFATRFHGWMGAAWGFTIAVGNIGAPREPIWSLLPLIFIPLLAGEARTGRVLGLDRWLRPRWARSERRWLQLVAEHGM